MSYMRLSQALANFIVKDLDYSEEKKEIITYSIEQLIFQVAGFISILLTAYFLDVFFPTAVAVIFGGSLRKLSGGAHLDSPLKCLIFSIFSYNLIGIGAQRFFQFSFLEVKLLSAILIICFLVVSWLAPVDCSAKRINSPVFRKKLKIASGVMMIISLIIMLLFTNQLFRVSLVLGIVFQTITLLPIFND